MTAGNKGLKTPYILWQLFSKYLCLPNGQDLTEWIIREQTFLYHDLQCTVKTMFTVTWEDAVLNILSTFKWCKLHNYNIIGMLLWEKVE